MCQQHWSKYWQQMVYASHSFKTRLFFSLFSQDHTSAIRHTLEKDEWKIITREICCATMNNKTSTDTLSAKKKHKKNISYWASLLQAGGFKWEEELTFLFFFLLFLRASPQQGENDSSLRVDTHSSHHHAPWTLHHMGPCQRAAAASAVQTDFTCKLLKGQTDSLQCCLNQRAEKQWKISWKKIRRNISLT